MKFLTLALSTLLCLGLKAQTMNSTAYASFEAISTEVTGSSSTLVLSEEGQIHGSLPVFSVSNAHNELISITLEGLSSSGEIVDVQYVHSNNETFIYTEGNTLNLVPGLKTDISFFFPEDIEELRLSSSQTQVLRQLEKHLNGQSLLLDPKEIFTNPQIECAQTTVIAVDASSSMSSEESTAIYNSIISSKENFSELDIQVIVFNDQIVFSGPLSDYLQNASGIRRSKNATNNSRTDWALIQEFAHKQKANHLVLITDNMPNMIQNTESKSSSALSSAVAIFNELKESGTHITVIGSDQITKNNAAYTMGLVTSLNSAHTVDDLSTDYLLKDIDYIVVADFSSLQQILDSKHFSDCGNKKELLGAISPNPVQDVLNINGLDDVEWTARLFDSSGKLQLVQQGTKGSSINITNLPSGTYEIQCTDAQTNQVLLVEKIIVID